MLCCLHILNDFIVEFRRRKGADIYDLNDVNLFKVIFKQTFVTIQ